MSDGPKLDYITGVVSLEVSPLCKSIVGADISKGMLGEFEKLKAPNMISKVIDGTIPPETQFDGQKFDVIFVRRLHTCLNASVC